MRAVTPPALESLSVPREKTCTVLSSVGSGAVVDIKSRISPVSELQRFQDPRKAWVVDGMKLSFRNRCKA